MAAIHVGISGWTYRGWRGEFYPAGLAQRRELEYATRAFNSVEINGSFYSLQTPSSYASWAETSPPGFAFAVKGSRYITHMLRLRNVETAVANFFASGVLQLGEKLGPILWQLPPKMDFQPEVVEKFCELLPRDSGQAARLAHLHDHRVIGRCSLDPNGSRRLRHAFEPRDPRFMNEQFIRILRKHGHALVFADTAGEFPYAEDITGDFIYIRLHGAEEKYVSGYRDTDLDWWSKRIQTWSNGGQMEDGERISSLKPLRRKQRDVYIYFDNDAKVHAPFDALRLAARLNLPADSWGLRGIPGDELPPPPRLVRERP